MEKDQKRKSKKKFIMARERDSNNERRFAATRFTTIKSKRDAKKGGQKSFTLPPQPASRLEKRE